MPPPSTRRIRDRVSEQVARALKRNRSHAAGSSSPSVARTAPAPSAPAPSAPAPSAPAPSAPAPSAPAPVAPRADPAEAPLVDWLLRGAKLGTAVLHQVRTWLADDRPDAAVGLAESLRMHDDTRALGDLASAVVAFDRGFAELAWARFAPLARETWAPYAAAEYARCGLSVDRDATVRELRQVIADEPTIVSLGDWITLAGTAFGAGEHALAGEMFDLAETVATATPDRSDNIDRRLAWLTPWVRAEMGSTSPRHERPVFAVMDYGHPGMSRGSANIGDHVQSIASLGHLVRHRSVRFHGEADLVALLDRLAGRTRPELRRDTVDADLDVLTIHRDASMYQEIPEGTWTLCFGWFMHQMFRMRYGFPLHDALRPLFVSFHCNKRDLLTDDAIAYLKRYGPVGCRDWTTVYLLLSAGVPAFFSGCLTTTISTTFPVLDEPPPSDAPVGYVDVPERAVPTGAPTYAHSDLAVRSRSFLENCDDAVSRLETYRRDLSAVVTSRLHAYLPLRSLGVPVDFRPGNLSDIRFDGLNEITDAEFDTMRDDLLELLEGVFGPVLAGAPEDEVYARWRELTAGKVAEAEARMRADAPSSTPVALDGPLAAAVETTTTVPAREPAGTGETVHCAVFVTKTEVTHLTPLVRSLVAGTSRPLHVWVIGRPKAAKTRKSLADAFPGATFSWVRPGRLDRAVAAPYSSPNAVARLVLPELLPGVRRVVVLPVSSVVEGDVAELADLDLGGHAFAAARDRQSATSGFHLLHAAAARLGPATGLSSTLRRTAHARQAFDFDAFATDLLVLDTVAYGVKLPRDAALGLVSDYGLRPHEVLHFLVGPDRAEIPETWQHVPGEDAVALPELVRWRSPIVPWGTRYVPERDRWRRHSRPVQPASAEPSRAGIA
ncbi:MAG: hypothetical protein ABIQ59_08940 [Nocardioidaceae bacterium]